MISPARLAAVRTIVTHADCADGVASALILRDALPGRPIVFLHYGSPAARDLPADPGMLFCDFSPPAERVREFVDAGAIVLDHHRTARAVVEAFGDDGVFGDESAEPGVCGAVLAFRHVWTPERSAHAPVRRIEVFAELAGIRDTWQRAHPQWENACAQSAALSFVPFDLLDRTLGEYTREWDDELGRLGRIVLRKKMADVSRSVDSSLRFTTRAGVRCAVFEGISLTSDAAEMLGEQVDLVIGFGFTAEAGHPKMIVSTRSHTTFDCAAFAKAHGGGGHTRAAGFGVPIGEDARDPFSMLRGLVDEPRAVRT